MNEYVYVDENNNKWTSVFTKKQAMRESRNLLEKCLACGSCGDCDVCKSSSNCTDGIPKPRFHVAVLETPNFEDYKHEFKNKREFNNYFKKDQLRRKKKILSKKFDVREEALAYASEIAKAYPNDTICTY